MAILVVGSDGNYAATNSVAPWAASIYRDIFSVQPTAAQIASVVTELAGGESMGTIVKGLLTNSDARKGYVISQFEKYLGRAPSTAELNGNVNYTSREQVVINIFNGPVATAYGSNVTGFVDAAYKDIVGFIDNSSTGAPFWISQISSGKSTRSALVTALVHSAGYYDNFSISFADPSSVVSNLYKLLPISNAGILRNLTGSSTPTNPNPALVTAYTNQLVAGTSSQEVVLASMMTNPQYISNSTYSRGIYVSPGIRT